VHSLGEEKYRHFSSKTLRKERQLAETKCRLKDNIKMEIKEIGCEGVDWSQSSGLG
jgi:hypothetical protein